MPRGYAQRLQLECRRLKNHRLGFIQLSHHKGKNDSGYSTNQAMERSTTTEHGREHNPLDTTGLCLLPLDGGSVRDLSTIYLWHSLDASQGQTRLVTLSRGHFEEPIVCHLQTIDLDTNPEYEALSYEWGSPLSKTSIWLDGCAIEVTKNLGCALRYLRSTSADRVMWIDAVCINQSDLEERAGQVRMMSRIYSNATQVVAWLGEGAARHMRNAEATLAAMQGHESIPWDFTDLDFHAGLWESLPGCLGRVVPEKYSGGEPVTTYWDRVWITQEVIFARSLVLQSEHTILTESKVAEIISQIKDDKQAFAQSQERAVRDSIDSKLLVPLTLLEFIIDKREKLRNAVRGKSPRPELHSLLVEARGSQDATDARDHVFALLGLAEPAAVSSIQIRYTSSVREVYTETFQAIVSWSSRLDVLCSSILGTANPDHRLPSWVSDWGSYIKKMNIFTLSISKNDRAAGDSRASVDYRLLGTDHVLIAKGFRLGLVLGAARMMPRLPPEMPAFELFQHIVRVYVVLSTIAGSPLPVESFIHSLAAPGSVPGLSEPAMVAALQLGKLAFEDVEAEDYLREICRQSHFINQIIWLKAQTCDVSCFLLSPSQTQPEESMVPTIGVGPVMEENDIVCLLFGCALPMVIRPKGQFYQVVGPVRINSLMDGCAMQYLDRGLYTLEHFNLV